MAYGDTGVIFNTFKFVISAQLYNWGPFPNGGGPFPDGKYPVDIGTDTSPGWMFNTQQEEPYSKYVIDGVQAASFWLINHPEILAEDAGIDTVTVLKNTVPMINLEIYVQAKLHVVSVESNEIVKTYSISKINDLIGDGAEVIIPFSDWNVWQANNEDYMLYLNTYIAHFKYKKGCLRGGDYTPCSTENTVSALFNPIWQEWTEGWYVSELASFQANTTQQLQINAGGALYSTTDFDINANLEAIPPKHPVNGVWSSNRVLTPSFRCDERLILKVTWQGELPCNEGCIIQYDITNTLQIKDKNTGQLVWRPVQGAGVGTPGVTLTCPSCPMLGIDPVFYGTLYGMFPMWDAPNSCLDHEADTCGNFFVNESGNFFNGASGKSWTLPDFHSYLGSWFNYNSSASQYMEFGINYQTWCDDPPLLMDNEYIYFVMNPFRYRSFSLEVQVKKNDDSWEVLSSANYVAYWTINRNPYSSDFGSPINPNVLDCDWSRPNYLTNKDCNTGLAIYAWVTPEMIANGYTNIVKITNFKFKKWYYTSNSEEELPYNNAPQTVSIDEFGEFILSSKIWEWAYEDPEVGWSYKNFLCKHRSFPE